MSEAERQADYERRSQKAAQLEAISVLYDLAHHVVASDRAQFVLSGEHYFEIAVARTEVHDMVVPHHTADCCAGRDCRLWLLPNPDPRRDAGRDAAAETPPG